MEPESCRVCGEATPAGARFCPSCGAGLGDDVLELCGDRRSQYEDDPTGGGRSWGVIVPLGAATLLIFGLALLSRDDPDRRGLGESGASGEAAADASPESTAPTTAPATSTTEPVQSARDGFESTPASAPPEPTPSAAPRVDLGDLPALDATHLAVRVRNQLQFLDLQTGVWTRAGLLSDVVDSYPVSTGLVLELPSRGIAFASVEGGELRYLTDEEGGLLGVRGDLVLVRSPGSVGDVQIRDLDGSEVSTIDLPEGAWAQGVTALGEVVVQAYEQIVLVDPITGDHKAIATGSVAGVLGDLVLVSHCTEDLECAVDQIDTRTGARERVTDELGVFLPSIGQPIVFSRLEGAGMMFFEVVDGVLVETGDSPLATGLGAVTPAHDRSGVTIELTDAIVFRDQTGEMIVEVPPPFPVDGPSPPELTLVGSRGLAS